MAPAEPVVQQIAGGIARAGVERIPPVLHCAAQILGEGDGSRSHAAIGTDSVFQRLLPGGEQRFERFGFDR